MRKFLEIVIIFQTGEFYTKNVSGDDYQLWIEFGLNYINQQKRKIPNF